MGRDVDMVINGIQSAIGLAIGVYWGSCAAAFALLVIWKASNTATGFRVLIPDKAVDACRASFPFHLVREWKEGERPFTALGSVQPFSAMIIAEAFAVALLIGCTLLARSLHRPIGNLAINPMTALNAFLLFGSIALILLAWGPHLLKIAGWLLLPVLILLLPVLILLLLLFLMPSWLRILLAAERSISRSQRGPTAPLARAPVGTGRLEGGQGGDGASAVANAPEAAQAVRQWGTPEMRVIVTHIFDHTTAN